MRLAKLLAVSLILASPVVAKPAPSPIAAAVADTGSRGADNVKLDDGRKPTQVLTFLKLRSGQHVLDLFGANAYWAEIEAPVVGSNGHVTVWQPAQFYREKTKASFASGGLQGEQFGLAEGIVEAGIGDRKARFDQAVAPIEGCCSAPRPSWSSSKARASSRTFSMCLMRRNLQPSA